MTDHPHDPQLLKGVLSLRHSARIAHRREVRKNLLTAAQDVGTTVVLRNIGTSLQLAADRHRQRREPAAGGTYHWGGLSLQQAGVTVKSVGGHTTVSGGGLSVAGWFLWIVIAVMVNRLWRAPGTWRARARPITAS